MGTRGNARVREHTVDPATQATGLPVGARDVVPRHGAFDGATPAASFGEATRAGVWLHERALYRGAIIDPHKRALPWRFGRRIQLGVQAEQLLILRRDAHEFHSDLSMFGKLAALSSEERYPWPTPHHLTRGEEGGHGRAT